MLTDKTIKDLDEKICYFAGVACGIEGYKIEPPTDEFSFSVTYEGIDLSIKV